jgi:imidazolonepropionase
MKAAPADPYGLIPDGAVVFDGGRVAWVGERSALPEQWRAAETRSAGGRLVTPGLVESHAHLIFGGQNPAAVDAEPGAVVQARLEATASIGGDELFARALRRAWWFVRQGVTTLELKAGYALEPAEQLRQLEVAGRLREALPITTKITLLAARAYPPGEDHEDYVLRVCDELLPAALARGGFDFVEVYCEEIDGVSMEDASTILETVYRKKVPTRVSADRLSDSAGGALAPAFYAKSAAYVVHTDDIAVKAMAKAGTIAVLVPGAAPFGENRPPVGLLRAEGVPIAVSTGFDPDSSPLADLRTAAHLGVAVSGLTRPEALHGITSIGGRALGGAASGLGTLVPSAPADFAVWDAEHPEDLVRFGSGPACLEVWSGGRRLEPPA